jgi:GTPase SAR1 family protein
MYVIALVVLLFVLIGILRRKSKPSKKEIALVGERGSGKTQLFIGLCGGKHFETVPSITNNTSTLQVGNKNYAICDFIGDNLSKEEVISELPRFHTIVHVVDGVDSKKLSDAALFIYRMLINKVFQKDPCNYVLFLNKDDEKGFHGLEKLVKRIEDEVETIKSSKRNQSEDNEGEEDYLRSDKTRFNLKGQGIIVVTGAAKTNRFKLDKELE